MLLFTQGKLDVVRTAHGCAMSIDTRTHCLHTESDVAHVFPSFGTLFATVFHGLFHSSLVMLVPMRRIGPCGMCRLHVDFDFTELWVDSSVTNPETKHVPTSKRRASSSADAGAEGSDRGTMEGRKEEDGKDVEEEAELRLPDGTTVKLPVLVDAAGQTFVDVRHLHTATGICTFDPGFSSTASCQSKITYIDGQKGVLLYRGYPIEQLAKQCSFVEVAYLLQYGELPTVESSMEFQEKLTYETMVHEHLIRFYQGFKPDAHPMAILVSSYNGHCDAGSYIENGLELTRSLNVCLLRRRLEL